MNFIEHWRWRYRDLKTGRIRKTAHVLTAEEAAKLPGAERIDGSMVLREPETAEFVDTGPEVYRSLDLDSEFTMPPSDRKKPTV